MSQNQQRIDRLQQRLASLHTNLETTKISRSSEASSQVTALRDRFHQSQEKTARRYESIAQLLDKVGKQIELQRQKNDQALEAKATQLDNLQQNVADVIAEEQQRQQQLDNNVQSLILDRTAAIKLDIQKETVHSNAVVDKLKNYLDKEIPEIVGQVRAGVQEREQTEELIQKQISEEFAMVQQGIAEEKRLREEQEEAMLTRLQEIRAKMQDAISHERLAREKSEETMINLLEQTCQKLNQVKFDV